MIRRFFGYSKKDAVVDVPDPVAQPGGEVMVAGGSHKGRPEHVAGTSSRHDWAGPGGVILLFNCHCCSFQMAEGSDTAALMAEAEDVTVTAAFNLQVLALAILLGRCPAPSLLPLHRHLPSSILFPFPFRS